MTTKYVYCEFDYVFFKFEVETDVEQAIYNNNELAECFYVFDEDTTVEQFHIQHKHFYDLINHAHVECGDFLNCKRRYYDNEPLFNEKCEQLKTALLTDFDYIMTHNTFTKFAMK